MADKDFAIMFNVGVELVQRLRAKKQASGMYSYNGMVLPALPEWDKETYPVAAIMRAAGTNYKYRLYFVTAPIYCSVSLGFHCAGVNAKYCRYQLSEDGRSWGELTFAEVESGHVFPGVAGGYSIKWINTDLYLYDGNAEGGNGELAISASDPIPV